MHYRRVMMLPALTPAIGKRVLLIAQRVQRVQAGKDTLRDVTLGRSDGDSLVAAWPRRGEGDDVGRRQDAPV
ncbi:hypothetical protein AB0D04_39665 [Streptomyces sp. NPDC048483]|uniref:hypothetical protein n=1 Tax=Streptomyces sp. NPDC048483 TaxID=3154927 RepID=UPI00342E1E42